MAAELHLPPGFRFHPTDEELVMHYLCRKCAFLPISVPIIVEIDLYKYNPWELPAKALYGEKEWYFFSHRDRKYPNGSRPNRGAGDGYWKATGADKPIGDPKPVAIKKALVFYAGKAPKGEKTNWIMHEYRLANVDRSSRNKDSLRLDDWVLCRIYNKKGTIEKQQNEAKKTLAPGPVPSKLAAPTQSDYLYFDTSDSVPRMHTDSSCSDHVASPEFVYEVQSEPQWKKLEQALDVSTNYANATLDGSFGNHFCGGYQASPLQDIFMHWQKPL